jgi:rhamnose utilization protein RhaD (predicted bifunctional aldolase and dehydrogenase)/NAD(P)-dependent dehydrogenase (short-subunit alcohol dehydrogenase family)
VKSLWNSSTARSYGNDLLQLRVYTSRLLGTEPSLVLHGGGNTSVKAQATNVFGDTEKILYVKGSGWDLATIEAAGFSPVKLDVLLRMVELPELTDSEMVRLQRTAMTDPGAPNPSVEAVLHAFIPFAFVDHTHADAVVTITNTSNGEARIRDLYGDSVLVVPYVMPGFVLAKHVYEMTRDFDWKKIEAMVLLNHGVFTFADDAETSYERMITIVSKAEDYLSAQGARIAVGAAVAKEDLQGLARLRRAVSRSAGCPMIARLDSSAESVAFSRLPNVESVATRGPLTPDHVIRTKRIPVVLGEDVEQDVSGFAEEYRAYFNRHDDGRLTSLDPAPRWAVWPEHGTVTFGRTFSDAEVVGDIVRHTTAAIRLGETLGGWHALPEKDIFDVEYWELEQAKLARAKQPAPFAGRTAFVTGAASGIGKACAEALRAGGAAVMTVDISKKVVELDNGKDVVSRICDITNQQQVVDAVAAVVRRFGGLDILISNAGVFPRSASIEEMDEDTWRRSIDTNLSGHRLVLQACIPFLKVGIAPAVVIIGSKNVPAPGRGAAAYSVAKAGLTQLARVAALELAKDGIRVNVIHPNNVFDTGIWTPEVLAARAERYGMTVEEYKANNLLRIDVTSADVAALACAMAGPLFAKTTGAQVPVDGGNERVI